MTTNTPAPADLVEAVAKGVADRCQGKRKPNQAPHRYATIFQAARLGARDAIAAYQAHMASDGVVQADRDRAQAYCNDPRHFRQTGLPGSGPSARQIMDEHFAAHRRAAAVGKNDSGWIVSNGAGDRWRTWNRGFSEWTAMRDHATRYARREDAEAVHAEDEDAWFVKPYAAPPVQAPMPGEVRELVARLLGMAPNTYGDDALEKGFRDAAALIQSLQREVEALKGDCAMLEGAHRTAEMRVTATQRVKDEAVGLLRPLVKALADADEDGLTEYAEPMIAARAFLAQHGGKHG